MKRDEVARIMKLVKEGKLSPEDAADLIEAFEESPDGPATPPPPPPPSPDPGAAVKDPLAGFLEHIERIGKDITTKVNWPEVSEQLKQGVTKGGEALKKAVEDANLGKITFGLWSSEVKTVTLPFSVSGDQVLRIDNPHGDVVVKGGCETTELIARATVRGHDANDARAKASQYIPVIEGGDSFVQIKQPEIAGIVVDLEVRLAQPAAIEVKGAAGDVELTKTGRSARIDGASGDVRLIGLEGNVEVRTSSGDVTLVDVRGDSVLVENKSGSLKFADVQGAMNLRTASGDITLERCGGRSLSIEAISGDVSIDLAEPIRGAVNIRTVQGDTILMLSDANDCRVSLSTLRGSIDCLLDLQDIQRFDRRVTGQMGEGSGTLDVSAVTGDVRVRQRIHT